MTGDLESEERRRRKMQRQLDQALADSFPASDPVSIVTSQAEEDWDAEPADNEGAAEASGEREEVSPTDQFTKR